VSIEDVQSLAPDVLRHRVLTNFYAESENITVEHIIQKLLESAREPVSGLN
jgi:MoxR-like ATPase